MDAGRPQALGCLGIGDVAIQQHEIRVQCDDSLDVRCSSLSQARESRKPGGRIETVITDADQTVPQCQVKERFGQPGDERDNPAGRLLERNAESVP